MALGRAFCQFGGETSFRLVSNFGSLAMQSQSHAHLHILGSAFSPSYPDMRCGGRLVYEDAELLCFADLADRLGLELQFRKIMVVPRLELTQDEFFSRHGPYGAHISRSPRLRWERVTALLAEWSRILRFRKTARISISWVAARSAITFKALETGLQEVALWRSVGNPGNRSFAGSRAAPALLKAQDCKAVAVISRDRGSAEEFATEHGIPAGRGSATRSRRSADRGGMGRNAACAAPRPRACLRTGGTSHALREAAAPHRGGR